MAVRAQVRWADWLPVPWRNSAGPSVTKRAASGADTKSPAGLAPSGVSQCTRCQLINAPRSPAAAAQRCW